MSDTQRPIAIFHEHPHWFAPLFAKLEERGTPFVRLDATQHHFDPASLNGEANYSLVFNRMSPSAYRRGHGQGIFYTQSYLAHLEAQGKRVINGSKAFRYETSKALQLSLLASLNLPYPKARVINNSSQAVQASEGLRFPIVVKPNIGGSGAGVKRFDSVEALQTAADEGDLDLGIDNTALVQEFIPARGQFIVRVEVLGGKFLYAIKVNLSGDTFDLCPADICKTSGGVDLERAACPIDAPKNGLTVEGFDPPADVREAVERIMQAAGIEVGGVEYIIDDRDGQLYYYDINALSNFVADGPRVIGFDPFERLAAFLEEEAR
jgi:D-Ala-D-Ala ligase-like protein